MQGWKMHDRQIPRISTGKCLVFPPLKLWSLIFLSRIFCFRTFIVALLFPEFWKGDLSHHRLSSGPGSDSTDFAPGPFLLRISFFVFSFLRYKGKERKINEEYLCSAFFAPRYTKSAQAWIIQFHLQITSCLRFPYFFLVLYCGRLNVWVHENIVHRIVR